MKIAAFALLLLFTASKWNVCAGGNVEALRAKLPADLKDYPPTVLVCLLVRNKAHILPYVLSYLDQQNYPKERMALWIRSDHNSDNSIDILKLWLKQIASKYHTVDFDFDETTQRHQNESSAYDWPQARFRHLISLKEAALAHAQRIWADYVFFLDADVLLTSRDTLRSLVSLRLPIVAPMLLSEGLYSNFWAGMSDDYYYKRTEEYREIYNVNKEGVFAVPMVHSAVLIHMNYMGSRYLTFDKEQFMQQQRIAAAWAGSEGIGKHCQKYNGPVDDIIVLAVAANCSNIPMFVSNLLAFGYIMQPLEATDNQTQDLQQLINLKVNMLHDLGAVPPVEHYFQPYIKQPVKTKMSLDHIYMINLIRRPERRQKMEQLFDELGLDVEHFAAVDGKELNLNKLHEMGIKFLPGYEDPYHHRQMTMGEIGCFLSHYRIWQRIVAENQSEVLILEDDIRFEPYFIERAMGLLNEARSVVEYDLIYFGRKRLKDESEPWVTGTDHLVHVGYSYWTLGYVISLQGAKKLLASKPMENLLPVDEFLPLMFNRHPNKTWREYYPVRNLMAFSAAPLILYPTHYTGENGYISDTENSELTNPSFESSSSSKTAAQKKSDRQQFFDEPAQKSNLEARKLEQNINIDNIGSKMHEEL